MINASPMFEVGAAVLGYVGLTASWRRPVPQYSGRYAPMLIVSSSASTDDGVHDPAASVTISGRDGLIALRAAIDEALKEGGAA